ncbi:T9SS type A sorting domain-containing protein [Hymenobacter weizhouensis]|uniref:T9SS type A sorting domain-containing protein n=1 Tax=Hymenobacter sp. YIM 151500-1 TaxID=2987689 RepID=UPI002227BE3E|nr:T9SS type A sorting domain-containing protein [Hymenobacter sp. YIM 151500-1]UYZ64753.1 T9SS type A sorting domain-containing protein [Hymenobacter sp. YIM 151500-1]
MSSFSRYLLSLLGGLALLAGTAAPAQVLVRPLGPEPTPEPAPTAGTARRPTALALPFFDDFSSQREGRPSVQRWETGGGTLVNSRFARRPPSRGVATLDGLDAAGRSRGPVSLIGDADSLVSQPLDLSQLGPGNNVYLSFYWQAGTLVGPPAPSGTRPIALYVDFLDRSGLWREVWRLNSRGDTTNFRFKALRLDQTSYFHNSFQFRFRTTGQLYNRRDAWSIDYVRLDRNRTATDSTFRDIATSRPLPSALRRYAAMPATQFNRNPAQELATRTVTTINNFDIGPAPTPITWTGTLEVLPGGPRTQFLAGGRSLDANARQQPVIGNPSTAAVPTTATPKVLRQRITLLTNETNPLTLPNDTITRLTELSDYYAYDDGTPEATITLPPTSTGPPSYLALGFDLNQPDQVRAIRLYLVSAAAGRTITVNVWDDANGQPAATPKATQAVTIPANLPAGQFLEVAFRQPVPVSGRFYAGFGEAPTQQNVELGFDLNNATPVGSLFVNSLGAWSVVRTASATSPEGSMLLRPVLGSTTTSVAPGANTTAGPLLYPNPTPDGRVQVRGSYVHATVLDVRGRVVWTQPSAQAGQPTLELPRLAAGAYFVRLRLPDGRQATKPLLIGW